MRFIRTIQGLSCAGVLAAATATLIIPTTAKAAVACNEAALVAAINAANAAGGGTVTLATGCTYTLTASHGGGAHGPDGLPLITTPITLSGDGSTITRAGGLLAPTFRIVEVTSTGALTTKSVTLSNGSTSGLLGLAGGDGGGIYNAGAVTLTNSTLSGNHAGARGGGIYNGLGAATFTSSTVSGNSVTGLLGVTGGDGGGIYNDGGTVTFTSGNLSSNRAAGLLDLVGGMGGGMYDNGGTVTVTSSFVESNTAHQAAGIVTINGIFTLTSTSVTLNVAVVNPGGIDRSGGTFTNDTSAITANTPTNCIGSPTAVPGCIG
jgi:hypothetical protein